MKVTRMVNGPEGFTPDNEFCLGETEVGGLFVAAGFCAHGLAGAGGIGKVMAEWIADGRALARPLAHGHPPLRRASYRSPSYTLKRIRETYETYYDIRYPAHEREAGRPLRVSPANAWHREHGARVRREVGLGAGQLVRVERGGRRRVGCARAAGPGATGRPRSAPSTAACREAAALFDESSFAKLEIAGPGAAALLERLCDNQVAREVGRITYTQMLNSRGGIECDFTVARLAEERFSIVTGTAFGNHDREWIRRHLPDDGSVQVQDVTSAWACLGIWGPRARDVLAPLTPQSLANEDFPYMSVREITVGDVPVRALRVTYVGELGWELYCPAEYGLDALAHALGGRAAARAGRRRLPRDRLAAPGEGLPRLGRRHHPRRDALRGRARVLREARQARRVPRARRARRGRAGRARQLACLMLADPRSVALGNEPVRVGGEVVGRVTTGGYGYTVGRSIAYAYLPPEHARARNGAGRGDLRQLDRGRGGRGAALRSSLRADQKLDVRAIRHYLGQATPNSPRSWSLRLRCPPNSTVVPYSLLPPRSWWRSRSPTR